MKRVAGKRDTRRNEVRRRKRTMRGAAEEREKERERGINREAGKRGKVRWKCEGWKESERDGSVVSTEKEDQIETNDENEGRGRRRVKSRDGTERERGNSEG